MPRGILAVIHLGRQLPADSSNLPGGSTSRAIAPLFGLAPDGVCLATSVTRGAVGSYPPVFRPAASFRHAPFHPRLIRRPVWKATCYPVRTSAIGRLFLCGTFHRLAASGR